MLTSGAVPLTAVSSSSTIDVRELMSARDDLELVPLVDKIGSESCDELEARLAMPSPIFGGLFGVVVVGLTVLLLNSSHSVAMTMASASSQAS